MLLEVCHLLYGQDWPHPLAESVARLVLIGMTEPIGPAERFLGAGLPDPISRAPATMPGRQPYGDDYIAAVRKDLQYFLDGWLTVANEYLEQHRETPADPGVGKVRSSLDVVLRLYSAGDDWPVEKTALMLTDFLRPYYKTAQEATTATTPKNLSLGGPGVLLKEIVWITGQIPEFVRTGHPRSAAIAERLKIVEDCLNGKSDENPREFLKGVIGVAPYEGIRICVGEKNKLRIDSSRVETATPESLLAAIAPIVSDGYGGTMRPLDPLLLLAVLADLTGESEAQDGRIASLFNFPHLGRNANLQIF